MGWQLKVIFTRDLFWFPILSGNRNGQPKKRDGQPKNATFSAGGKNAGVYIGLYIFNYPLGLRRILDFSNMQFLSEVTAYLVKNVNLKFDLNELIWHIDRTIVRC